MRHSVVKPIVIALAIVLVVLIAAEAGARWYIGRELKDEFQQSAERQGVEMTEDPSISFGASPVVLALITRNVGHLTAELPSTLTTTDNGEVAGQPATNITANDLNISDQDNPTAGWFQARAELSDDFLRATATQALGEAGRSAGGDLGASLLNSLIKISDVSSSGTDNAVTVNISGGAGKLIFVPTVESGRIIFSISDAEVFGIDLPQHIADSIGQALTEGAQHEVDKLGNLTVTDIEVQDGQVVATVEGNDVPLKQLGQAAEQF